MDRGNHGHKSENRLDEERSIRPSRTHQTLAHHDLEATLVIAAPTRRVSASLCCIIMHLEYSTRGGDLSTTLRVKA